MKVDLFSTKESQDPEKFENLSEFGSLEDQEPAFGHVLKPVCLTQFSAIPYPTL